MNFLNDATIVDMELRESDQVYNLLAVAPDNDVVAMQVDADYFEGNEGADKYSAKLSEDYNDVALIPSKIMEGAVAGQMHVLLYTVHDDGIIVHVRTIVIDTSGGTSHTISKWTGGIESDMCWPSDSTPDSFAVRRIGSNVWEFFSDVDGATYRLDMSDGTIVVAGNTYMPSPRSGAGVLASSHDLHHYELGANQSADVTPGRPESLHFPMKVTRQVPAGRQRIRLIENPDPDTKSLLLMLDPDGGRIHYRIRSRRVDVGEYWQEYVVSGVFGTEVLVYPSRSSNFLLLGDSRAIPILSLSEPDNLGRKKLIESETLRMRSIDLPEEWSGSFPKTGAFYQGRLFLANHDRYPGRLWGSNSLLYTAGEQAEAEEIKFEFRDDASSSIDVSLPGDERIVWLHPSHDRLMLGSNKAEYVIGSNEPLTNINIQLQPQSFHGSETPYSSSAADKVLWFDRSGVLRGTSYLRSNNAWVSQPVGITGLFGEDRNHEVTLYRRPERDMVVVCGGAVTKLGTFKDDMGRIGWGNMIMHGWTVISAASELDEDGNNESLYLLIANNTDTGDLRLVEYSEDVYLDCWEEKEARYGEVTYSHQAQGGWGIATLDNEFIAETGGREEFRQVEKLDFVGAAQAVRVGQFYTSQLVTLALVYGFEGGTTIDLVGNLVTANAYLENSPAPGVYRNGKMTEGVAGQINQWRGPRKYALNVQESDVERYFEVIRSRTEPMNVMSLSGILKLGSFNTVQGLAA